MEPPGRLIQFSSCRGRKLWESDPTAHISIRPAVCHYGSSAGNRRGQEAGQKRERAGERGEEKEVGGWRGRQRATGKSEAAVRPRWP